MILIAFRAWCLAAKRREKKRFRRQSFFLGTWRVEVRIFGDRAPGSWLGAGGQVGFFHSAGETAPILTWRQSPRAVD